MTTTHLCLLMSPLPLPFPGVSPSPSSSSLSPSFPHAYLPTPSTSKRKSVKQTQAHTNKFKWGNGLHCDRAAACVWLFRLRVKIGYKRKCRPGSVRFHASTDFGPRFARLFRPYYSAEVVLESLHHKRPRTTWWPTSGRHGGSDYVVLRARKVKVHSIMQRPLANTNTHLCVWLW